MAVRREDELLRTGRVTPAQTLATQQAEAEATERAEVQRTNYAVGVAQGQIAPEDTREIRYLEDANEGEQTFIPSGETVTTQKPTAPNPNHNFDTYVVTRFGLVKVNSYTENILNAGENTARGLVTEGKDVVIIPQQKVITRLGVQDANQIMLSDVIRGGSQAGAGAVASVEGIVNPSIPSVYGYVSPNPETRLANNQFFSEHPYYAVGNVLGETAGFVITGGVDATIDLAKYTGKVVKKTVYSSIGDLDIMINRVGRGVTDLPTPPMGLGEKRLERALPLPPTEGHINLSAGRTNPTKFVDSMPNPPKGLGASELDDILPYPPDYFVKELPNPPDYAIRTINDLPDLPKSKTVIAPTRIQTDAKVISEGAGNMAVISKADYIADLNTLRNAQRTNYIGIDKRGLAGAMAFGSKALTNNFETTGQIVTDTTSVRVKTDTGEGFRGNIDNPPPIIKTPPTITPEPIGLEDITIIPTDDSTTRITDDIDTGINSLTEQFNQTATKHKVKTDINITTSPRIRRYNRDSETDKAMRQFRKGLKFRNMAVTNPFNKDIIGKVSQKDLKKMVLGRR